MMRVKCAGCGKEADLADDVAQQLFAQLENFEDTDHLYFTCTQCRDNPKVQENIAKDIARRFRHIFDAQNN